MTGLPRERSGHGPPPGGPHSLRTARRRALPRRAVGPGSRRRGDFRDQDRPSSPFNGRFKLAFPLQTGQVGDMCECCHEEHCCRHGHPSQHYPREMWMYSGPRWAYEEPSPEARKAFLAEQKAALERRLKMVDARLKELGK